MSSVSVKRTTSVLFLLRVFRMLMSLVTVALTAKYFGVSVEKDAWLLVTVMLSSITLMIWGPINETFRAKFIFIRERESESRALKAAAALFSGIVMVTCAIITLLAIFAPPIADFSAMDLQHDGITWFLSLFLVLLPTLLIDEINNIASSILNAYDIFYLPEIVGSVTVFAYIAILIFVAPALGIYAMVIGQYVSTITLTAVLFIAIRRKRLFSLSWFTKPDFRLVKPFIVYALPFFFPYAVGQFNAFSERWLAGILGVGNISILDFGRRFSVTTIMVPMLAKAHASNDSSEFSSKLNEHLSVIYGIMLLAIPLLFGAAYPLCDFLYHRGSVTTQNIVEISTLCQFYAIAFLCVMIYVVFGNVLLASEKGKPYALWGVIAQVLVMGLNFGLVSVVGLIIFPISLGLVHIVTGCIMWAKGRAWGLPVVLKVMKYNAVVILSSIVVYVISQYLQGIEPLMQLCVSTGIIIVLACCLSPLIDINPWTILRRIRK